MSLQALAFKTLSLALIIAACWGLSAAQAAPSAQGTRTEVFLETLALAQSKTDAREWNEAAALWEKVVALNSVEGRFWNGLATAHYNAKNYRRAISAYEKVVELGYGNPANAAYNIACNYALLGEKEQALKWLEKAFEMRFLNLQLAQTDEDLQSIRDEPRYRNLVGLVDASKWTREEGWRYDLQFLTREIKRRGYNLFPAFLPKPSSTPK